MTLIQIPIEPHPDLAWRAEHSEAHFESSFQCMQLHSLVQLCHIGSLPKMGMARFARLKAQSERYRGLSDELAFDHMRA